jgi:hypothetical protein
MAIIHQEVLEERARNLVDKGLNGMELVLVRVQPAVNPTEALLEVHFFNNLELANIVNVRDFLISGGHRVLGGRATGEVQVTAIAHPSPTSNIRVVSVPNVRQNQRLNQHRKTQRSTIWQKIMIPFGTQ